MNILAASVEPRKSQRIKHINFNHSILYHVKAQRTAYNALFSLRVYNYHRSVSAFYAYVCAHSPFPNPQSQSQSLIRLHFLLTPLPLPPFFSSFISALAPSRSP